MKRVLTTVAAAFCLAIGFNNSAGAQIVEKGNLILDPYVGFPTANAWWGQSVDALGDDWSTAGSPVSFGGRVEYLLADKFGLGIDANYAVAGYKYSEDRVDENDPTQIVTGEYKYTSKKLRVMLRGNFHVINSDKANAYVGVGAGYRSVTREATFNGSNDSASLDFTLIPIAMRFAFGGRYYFHPNIGMNWEFGLGGGGILQTGLSIKL